MRRRFEDYFSYEIRMKYKRRNQKRLEVIRLSAILHTLRFCISLIIIGSILKISLFAIAVGISLAVVIVDYSKRIAERDFHEI